MRINIYGEELTDRLEVIEKTAENTGETFIGIRFYLKTHEDMYPPCHDDDDSNAVTFWFGKGEKHVEVKARLRKLLGDAKQLVNEEMWRS